MDISKLEFNLIKADVLVVILVALVRPCRRWLLYLEARPGSFDVSFVLRPRYIDDIFALRVTMNLELVKGTWVTFLLLCEHEGVA